MENNKAVVDDALFKVLSLFSNAAEQVGVPWLVIGATARVMLLEKAYGLPAGLATQDIDFAVQVGDWDHYQQLREIILKDNSIETGRPATHRFKLDEGMIFDLVPYGGVENEKKQIVWPPDNDVVMSVRGFSGASANAVPVIINGKLTVPVVSPVGLCALKFFAWQQRHTQHPGRDAKDVAYLFNHIEALYSSEKLFSDYEDAVEAADYQIQSAGHYQLGRDVKELLAKDDHGFIVSFLSDEISKTADSALCREMHRHINMTSIDDTEKALSYFYKGLSSD